MGHSNIRNQPYAPSRFTYEIDMDEVASSSSGFLTSRLVDRDEARNMQVSSARDGDSIMAGIRPNFEIQYVDADEDAAMNMIQPTNRVIVALKAMLVHLQDDSEDPANAFGIFQSN